MLDILAIKADVYQLERQGKRLPAAAGLIFFFFFGLSGCILLPLPLYLLHVLPVGVQLAVIGLLLGVAVIAYGGAGVAADGRLCGICG